MNKSQMLGRIFSTNEGYSTITESFRTMRNQLLNNDYEAFDKTLRETFNDSEKTCLKMRRLVIDCAKSKKEANDVNSSITKAQKGRVRIDDNGIITLKIPPLLPFKKVKTVQVPTDNFAQEDEIETVEVVEKANSIVACVKKLMTDLAVKNDLTKFDYKEPIICYHNYYANKNFVFHPDTDNYEYNQITNAIMETLNNGDDNKIKFVLESSYKEQTYCEIKVFPSTYSLTVRSANRH